ncbi:MAG: tetratricopeptide repeat protein [Cocleimonas sp.]
MLFSSYKSDVSATENKCLLFSAILLTNLFCLLSNPVNAGILEKSVTQEAQFQSQDLYQALTAEIYNKLGEDHLAVDYYYKLSASNNDPAIAKRVTELATVTGQIAKALDGAKRWVELKPSSLEANQYLTLLYLRNSHFTLAAKQLDSIRTLIEETSDVDLGSKNHKFQSSESLTFIGALLAAEAHHGKAFTVFNLYTKEHAIKIKNHAIYNKQQRLIAAQLAMKAKKYSFVVSSLDGLKNLDAQNYVDATVMHAKALHKLRQNKQAIIHLRSIQNHPETNDSHRLELVRLLVLEKQKDAALPILETLVVKHSKNLELLKSLIALQIDQSKLSSVSNNISKLRSNIKYSNEADYFSGEFAEKLGQQEIALLSYEKVVKGSYLKNAHKKRISLTKRIHGQTVLNNLFHNEQREAETISDQAYWTKLQADELFESKQYTKALSLYNKAVTIVPTKIRYRYKRGLANERLGNLAKAETDFNFVLAKRDNDADTLNALGYMLSVHTKRFTEAKAHISKAYILRPNDPLILDSLGFVLYKTGELNKAEKYLRKAFKLNRKPEIASHLITVLAELNQHQEAKNIYLQMRKIYPNSPSLQGVSHYIP